MNYLHTLNFFPPVQSRSIAVGFYNNSKVSLLCGFRNCLFLFLFQLVLTINT